MSIVCWNFWTAVMGALTTVTTVGSTIGSRSCIMKEWGGLDPLGKSSLSGPGRTPHQISTVMWFIAFETQLAVIMLLTVPTFSYPFLDAWLMVSIQIINVYAYVYR